MNILCRSLIAAALTGLFVNTPLWASEAAGNPALIAAARAANSVYQRNLEATRNALLSENESVRVGAIAWLGRSKDPQVVSDLLPFLDRGIHSEAEVRTAINALTWMKVDISPQLRILAQKYPEMDAVAYAGLARLEKWGTEDWKSRALAKDEGLRASAVTNLGNDINNNAGEILANAMLTDKEPHTRRMGVIGLAKLGDPSYGPQLARALSDPNPRIRRYAAGAIARLNYTEGIPYLLMAMQSNIASKYLNKAVVQLSGEDFGFDHRASLTDRQSAIDRGFAWYASQQNL